MRTPQRIAAALAVVATLATAAGCGGDARLAGAADSGTGPIAIGIEGTLSGSSPVPGYVDGAQAFFRAQNAQGGIGGRQIQTFTADTANQGPQTVTVTRSLVERDHVAGLLSFATVPAQALVKLIPSLRVPAVILADGDLFQSAQPYLYSGAPSYHAMAKQMLAAAKQNFHAHKVAITYEDDSFGQPLADVAAAYCRSVGLDLTATVPVPKDQASNFVPYAARLRASGAEAVVMLEVPELTTGVINASAAIGYHPAWVTNWGAETPAVAKAVGDAGMRNVHILDFHAPVATSNAAEVQDFKKAITQYYPQELTDSFAEQGWTDASIMAYAIRQAEHAGKVTPDSINTALATMRRVPVGLQPSITYDSTQHIGISNMMLVSYRDGKFYQQSKFAPLPAP